MGGHLECAPEFSSKGQLQKCLVTSHPCWSKAAQWDMDHPYIHTVGCGNMSNKLVFKDIPDGWSSGGKWEMNRQLRQGVAGWYLQEAGTPWTVAGVKVEQGQHKAAPRMYLLPFILGSLKLTHLGIPQRTDYSTCCVQPEEFWDGRGTERWSFCWSMAGISKAFLFF